ncbi:alkaline ceramidase Ypc1p [Trichomonascus vanleenenianus]|uniref:ceramidase n=1 Tax=Trichomonascus vanleenenianus TaxID=2268995 RepID=UPI003EC9B4B9
MSFPWAWEYPEVPESGYWGLQTATIDWCEENYVVSHYIAEAANTLTNALFVGLAVYAMYNVIRNKHEKRFLIVALGFATVGIGSWMFHMTLLYEYQLLDELPMIYATCVPYWIVFSYGKSRADSVKVALQISSAAAILTAVYLYYRNPTIHQAGYGFLNLVIVVKSVALTHKYVDDQLARKHLRSTLIIGLASFLGGYAIWNLDIHLCTTWRSTRRSIGMPYGLLLEFHGWWHLLTGLGVYYYIVYLEYLRLFLTNREHKYVFRWSYGFLPHVDLIEPNKIKLT